MFVGYLVVAFFTSNAPDPYATDLTTIQKKAPNIKRTYDVPVAPDMFKDVPTTHWVYAAADKLESHGAIWGYPYRYFSGKRELSRFEFAVALDRALKRVRDVSRTSTTISGGKTSLYSIWSPSDFQPADGGLLLTMMDEFRRELSSMSWSSKSMEDNKRFLLDVWEAATTVGIIAEPKPADPEMPVRGGSLGTNLPTDDEAGRAMAHIAFDPPNRPLADRFGFHFRLYGTSDARPTPMSCGLSPRPVSPHVREFTVDLPMLLNSYPLRRLLGP